MRLLPLLDPWTASPVVEVHDRSIEDIISAVVSERQREFSMRDALGMPSVARAVDLISSIGASFPMVEFTGGRVADEQARLIRRPDPFSSRYEWTEQTLTGLIEDGEAFWLLGEADDRGYPRWARVIPNSEVLVQWDERRFGRLYEWRGRRLTHGVDIYHVAINRRPGDLHGRSALKEALPYLATIDAAEAFAASTFGSNGIPLTVLKAAADLTKDEADRLKAQWSTNRLEHPYEPAVASGGIEPEFPGMSPQTMQMQESRSYGATVVARLLGIPAPLLHVETSGATLVYSNEEGAIDALVKGTIVPRYLNPIEGALSDIVPRTKAVRFDVNELNRADVKTRYEVYASAITSGVMTADEARAMEGMSDDVTMEPALAPVPNGGPVRA